MPDASRDHPGVIAHPPVLFVGVLVIGLLLHWLFPHHPFPSTPARIVGGVLVLGAIALGIWGNSTMVKAGTNVHPREPALTIVTTGPFRFSRNPLYTAVTALYLGITLIVNALWPLILLVPLLITVHYGIVRREERYLEAKFGETYLSYKRRVRRWI